MTHSTNLSVNQCINQSVHLTVNESRAPQEPVCTQSGNVSKHEGICLICGSLPLSQILLFFSSTVKCLHSIGSLDESPWKAPRHLPPQGELAQWVVCASCCFSCAMCNRCLISTITVKTSLPLSLL